MLIGFVTLISICPGLELCHIEHEKTETLTLKNRIEKTDAWFDETARSIRLTAEDRDVLIVLPFIIREISNS